MNVEQPSAESTEQPQPKWQPLSSYQRRVAGVLVEKAKTTPDAYPMTLNALTNGCNQKSNRSPQLNLSAEQIEETLDELREMGAVAEVQASGRVAKFRHYMYDWLGVDKVELAVMAELLLRGEQTVGELRTRAARMEPIADLGALRPIVTTLIQKGLMISLTPEGRGQIVTHALYKDREMTELKARSASVQSALPETRDAAESSVPASPQPAASTAPSVSREKFEELASQVDQLRSEVGELRQKIRELEEMLQ